MVLTFYFCIFFKDCVPWSTFYSVFLQMVCHGLNDEVKMGCKDSLKKCRDINNPIDKEECVLEEIEKACLAETETAEFDQCADVYAVIKCSRLPKASDERKQCKQDAKTYLSDKHTPGPN